MLDQPLRILMVAPQPFFRPRGTPVSVLHRIRALRHLGHHVDLVTYPFGADIELNGADVYRSGRPPLVHDVSIGPSIPKIFLDVPLFWKAYRRAAKGGYDLIHTHEEAGLLGALVSQRLGLPHLYDMHSSLPQQFTNFQRFAWPPVIAAFSRLERFALAHSAGVITVYPELRDHVAASGYDGPLVVLENTLDFEAPPPDPEADEELRKRLKLNGRFTVVYTGTLEPYQGMELLVDAAALLKEGLPEVKIVSVGGTPRQIAALRERAADNGGDPLFEFVKMVPPKEVFQYHRVADALITCRIHGTNTPLKLYQYLRSGRPIIATRIDSHTQVLNDEVAELVPPTPEGIAEGIQRIAEDRARGDRLARAAVALKERRYSEQAYLDTLRCFMGQVVGEPPQTLGATE